jgi:hypothetical protein
MLWKFSVYIGKLIRRKECLLKKYTVTAREPQYYFFCHRIQNAGIIEWQSRKAFLNIIGNISISTAYCCRKKTKFSVVFLFFKVLPICFIGKAIAGSLNFLQFIANLILVFDAIIKNILIFRAHIYVCLYGCLLIFIIIFY